MNDPATQPNDAVMTDLQTFGFDSEDDWLACFRRAEDHECLGTIGRYDIIEEIGRGGQGVVYRARQAGVDSNLALKRLVGGCYAEAHTRQRFEREMRAVSALSHPGIVSVHALELVDGQPLLAMHWIDGQPISVWARSGRRPYAEILETFAQVCAAVQHAHQRGVIHRDLKPSNILVDANDAPHVLDFGLARQLDSAADEPRITATLQFIGTPAYAAPEQLEDPDTAVDTRVDVYALGVVLFEMLTGQLPYEARGSLVEVARVVREIEPRRPSSVDPHIARDLDAIVLKSLAKEPQHRYQSVEALIDDVQRYLAGDPVRAHPPSRLYRLGKLLKRNRLAVTLTAMLLVTILAGSALAAWLALEARKAHDEERAARVVAEHIGDFLGDVLSAARPSRGGADMKLLEVLSEASARAEAELGNEPEVAAEVFYRIGETYRALWRSQDGLPYLNRALQLFQEVHTGDHEDVAKTLTALGAVHTSRRAPEAVSLQRSGLAMRRRLYGDEHALVAVSLMRLGYALHQAADEPAWDEAEKHLTAALAMSRRVHGPAHRDVAACLHNIGWMRVRQNRIAEALESYSDAADIFRQLGDMDDPFYAECLYGYAAQLMKIERYAEALAAHDEVIPLVRRVYGDNAALPLMWQRCAAHQALQDYSAARRAYNDAAVVQCEQQLRQEPDAAAALAGLRVSLVTASRDLRPAIPHDDMLRTIPVLSAGGRQRMMAALHRAAGLLLSEGHDDQAVLLIDRLRLAHEKYGIPSGAQLAMGLETLADHAAALGDHTRACALIVESLTIATQAYPDIMWDHARLRSKRGACLAESGHLDEARELLHSSHTVLIEAFGADHALVHDAESRINRYEELRAAESDD